ncbi:hypothetical protein ACFVJS_03715 [Nocardioides sp. NPDC057772]|uniref:hypothetical protein n=1 Tax=Nocardioides sp. NPDC057772 TaxID=3346245 RepID=UPI00366D46ED
MENWYPIEPRLVWILRRGVTPLPAWPGLLVGWQHIDGKPSALSWKGLVTFSRYADQPPELKWFFPCDLRKVAEEPPMCGGGNYPEPGPWTFR